MSGLRAAARLLLGGLALAGLLACAEAPAAADGAEGIHVDYTSEQGLATLAINADPLRVGGGNVVRVHVRSAGSEVGTVTTGGAADVRLVSASAFMPAHAHGVDGTVNPQPDGAYAVDDLAFFMPGRWELRFTVAAGGREDRVRFSVDVR